MLTKDPWWHAGKRYTYVLRAADAEFTEDWRAKEERKISAQKKAEGLS